MAIQDAPIDPHSLTSVSDGNAAQSDVAPDPRRFRRRKIILAGLVVIVVAFCTTYVHRRNAEGQALIDAITFIRTGATREQVEAELGHPEWTETLVGYPYGNGMIGATHPAAPPDRSPQTYTLCVWSAGKEKATVAYDKSGNVAVRWVHTRPRRGNPFWKLLKRLL